MAISDPESLNLLQRVTPGGLPPAACRQKKVRSVVGASQLGGHEQDVLAQSLQGRALHLRRQAQSLVTS